ncbi:hypothetical protein [Pseudomonas sp. LS-2]|uniref:hypothetical protein n=1 Tax=Pseudomonas sp. LS-2 TaxID=2315859 RepID=UPI000E76D29E|nr:hypothetical protein [Pseudomonas sp. LS-2]RJX72597.1 hypothetical protein D3M70_30810 [Pseudomonas sp. LS-2]
MAMINTDSFECELHRVAMALGDLWRLERQLAEFDVGDLQELLQYVSQAKEEYNDALLALGKKVASMMITVIEIK